MYGNSQNENHFMQSTFKKSNMQDKNDLIRIDDN